MQKWIGVATALLLMVFSFTAQSADWHCITTTSQTSVDFEGKVIRSTCIPTNLDSAQEAEEKKNCERGSKKNKTKQWLAGTCPTQGLISTCTITKIGPATLPQPKIVHTYEEQGGNLSRADEVNLARQQCSQMSLNSGEFVEVAPGTSSVVEADMKDTTQENSEPVQIQEQNNEEGGAVKKGISGAKKTFDSIKGKIFK